VRQLPMFPLGTVLFPHMVLPLHVFEPRYRALLRDVLDADGEFGVTLISRGHEVGGGDLRTDVGTVARVIQAEELEDGRWLVIAVGTRRIRVDRWLPDDPYPLAVVEDLTEDPVDADAGAEDDTGTAELFTATAARLRRVLAMQAELGEEATPSTFALADDPAVADWQLAVVAPLNPLDAQRVLTVDGRDQRLVRLADALEGLEAAYAFRLGGDG
jgi:uncharacterized protein